MSLPSITPSGASFGDLKANNGVIALVIAANAFSAAQRASIRAVIEGPYNKKWYDLNTLVRNYLNGCPDDISAMAQTATDLATVWAALAEVAAEVAALITANPGTLVTAAQGVSGLTKLVRTFP